MKGKRHNFTDTVLIFHSPEDNCWIAHGLRTDQIGTGVSVLDALTDAIKAIDQVMLIAHDDPTVAYQREAPPEIQAMAKEAKPLPREIYEIAHRRTRGEWPDELPVEVNPDNDSSFTTEVCEPV